MDTTDAFTLKNGLSVVVTSRPSTDTAAAAMVIDVGSAHDPADARGTTHFLEHLLFMGSEPYPEPNAFGRFVSDHGGSANAGTDLEHSVYVFHVRADGLLGALDRWAPFFYAPLLSKDAITNEVHAVDAEFRRLVHHDSTRVDHVRLRPLFPCGNAQTLSGVTRRSMWSFFHEKYRAGNMSLSVVGKESCQDLRSAIEARFARVRQGSHALPRTMSPSKSSKAKTSHVVTEVEPSPGSESTPPILYACIAFPSVRTIRGWQPADVVARAMQRALTDLDLDATVAFREGDDDCNHSRAANVHASIWIPDASTEHTDRVVGIVYGTVRRLALFTEQLRTVFDTLCNRSETLPKTQDPLQRAVHDAMRVRRNGCGVGDSSWDRSAFDATLLQHMLEHARCEWYVVRDPRSYTKGRSIEMRTEPYTGARFHTRRITLDPSFLPTKGAITFKNPFASANARHGRRRSVIIEMRAKAYAHVQDAVRAEIAWEALADPRTLADLESAGYLVQRRIEPPGNRFVWIVTGHATGIARILVRAPPKSRIQAAKRRLERAYAAMSTSAEITAHETMGHVVYPTSAFTSSQKLAALRAGTSSEDPWEWDTVSTYVYPSSKKNPPKPVLTMLRKPPARGLTTIIAHSPDTNHAVKYSMYAGAFRPRTYAMALFAASILRERAFRRLRTEEQLGYVVHVHAWTDAQIVGISIDVVSGTYTSTHVVDRIRAFLSEDVMKNVSFRIERDAAAYETSVILRDEAETARAWYESMRIGTTRDEIAGIIRQIRRSSFESWYRNAVWPRQRAFAACVDP